MGQFRVEKSGSTEVWTILGEQRRNAITRAMLAELEQLVDRISASRESRCVLLTGEGSKAFCAGADLKGRGKVGQGGISLFLRPLQGTLRSIEKSDAVFIAAI